MFYPKRRYYLLIIAAVGILAYSNTLHVPFVFDGKGQIRDNLLIRDLNNFRLAMEGVHFSQRDYLYVPTRFVGYLSFGINYFFGGLNVVGYHLTNLVIHIASSILVYFLVLLTFSTPFMLMGARPRDPPDGSTSHTAGLFAMFTALLFVSHPVQTEAVTYIVQRFSSLATMFFLLALVAYVKGRLAIVRDRGKVDKEHGHNVTADGIMVSMRSLCKPGVFFCISLFSAVLAMRTKEISFTLPIVVVIYEFLFFPVPLRKRLVFLVPTLMTLAIIPVALLGVNEPISQVLSDVINKTRLGTSVARSAYLLTQTRVITTYIRLLFFPFGQNVDYDYPVYHSFFSPPVFMSSLFLFSLMGLAAYMLYKSKGQRAKSKEQRAKGIEQQAGKQQAVGSVASNLKPETSNLFPVTSYYRLAGFGILWLFVTLSVTSSIVPIADVIFEHRLYLPSIGAFIAIVAIGFALKRKLAISDIKRERMVVGIFCAVIMIFSVTTYSRNAVWGTRMSLWQDAVAKSPNKARPHCTLGKIYYKQNRLDEAVREFQTALKLQPDYAIAHNNLGSVFAAKRLLMKAQEEFQTAVNLDPDYEDAHYNLGQVLLLMGRTDRAMSEFRSTLRLNPSYVAAYNKIGEIYYKQNRLDEAVREFQTALKFQPGYAAAHNNLGSVFAAKGLLTRAQEEFQTAVNLNPDYEDAHYNLAQACLLLGQKEKAVMEFQAALRLKPSDTAALRNLEALQGR